MKNAKNVYVGYMRNMVSSFIDIITDYLYTKASKSQNWNFSENLEDVVKTDERVAKFVKENNVPNCVVEIFQEDDWHFEIKVNGKSAKEFDWEVSDEIVDKHADDWEIEKDEMFNSYDDYCADYYDGDDYSESICDFDE